jgi:hypothetical protein
METEKDERMIWWEENRERLVDQRKAHYDAMTEEERKHALRMTQSILDQLFPRTVTLRNPCSETP